MLVHRLVGALRCWLIPMPQAGGSIAVCAAIFAFDL